VKFSYNLLKKFVDLKESPEELAEILTLKTTEIEEIEKAGNDYILEIKILPNRSDLLSHYGMAREIAALTGDKLKGLDLDYKETKEKTSDLILVEVENTELCPRYTAQIIKNVKIGESPKWLKDVLEGLGLNSINNVVDIVNYVMIEMGQPLHAFDFDRLAPERDTNTRIHTNDTNKKQVIVRNAKKGEKIKVLDEAQTEYELDENMLLIADSEKPLAVAGIKGGAGSEISKTTQTIVLESANFNPVSIRRTSIKLGLRTDASIRFSYGLDPNLAETAVDRAAGLIQELAGGEITKGTAEVYPKKLRPWKVAVKKEYIDSLMGVKIPGGQTKKILAGLGMSAVESKDKFVVAIPTRRLDVQTPEDIIEEIARIYGYEKIKPIPPVTDIYRPAEDKASEDWDIEQTIKARNLMKNILKGLGLSECYNYSFLGENTKEVFNISNAPEIANPISREARYLRTGLIPNLILAIEKNLRFYDSVRLFEAGDVFIQRGDEVEEKEIIAGVIAAKGAFIELKGALESFLKQLGIGDAEFSDDISGSHSTKIWYHPGRVAEVQIGKRTIGLIGDLHPHIKNGLGIGPSVEVAQFSLLMEPLVKSMEEELEFEPIPKYPATIRDISLLVDKNIRISEILNLIESADTGRIVQDVDVFDIYEDNPEIPGGKKSVAFHMIYRANDRTLTDTEVDKVEQSIKKALGQGLGAEIR
jgi:phenylalanyl-tRNA synthetase beta chain